MTFEDQLLTSVIGVAVQIPICFFLSTVSFLYYVGKSKASEDAILAFIDTLPRPIRNLYVGKNPIVSKILTERTGQSLVDYLKSVSPRFSFLFRLIISLVPLQSIGAILIALSRDPNTPSQIVILITLIIYVVLLVWAWRFGHPLLNSEVTQSGI